MKSLKILLTFCSLLAFLFLKSTAFAVYVKYHGEVGVKSQHFEQQSLKVSSFIHEIYYDKKNKYLVVKLKNSYYIIADCLRLF